MYEYECCDVAFKPYYVAAGYQNEEEGHYWFCWWARYEYAKRQMMGAIAAKSHVVVR
jgi:hypothetical protein